MKCEDCPWKGFEVSKEGLVPTCTLDFTPETCDTDDETEELT